ncbi:MAG: septum formation initiator family protein [Chitinophagales bacterium]|nr:septum formation initiator family protein [Chitinophagales bacterium]
MKINFKTLLYNVRRGRIAPFFKNKYVITVTAFLVWMLFFDKNDIITQIQLHQKLRGYQQKKEYYQQQIKEVNNTKRELQTNQASLEKFARERYMMKKDNEDLYVIVPAKKEEKKIN